MIAMRRIRTLAFLVILVGSLVPTVAHAGPPSCDQGIPQCTSCPRDWYGTCWIDGSNCGDCNGPYGPCTVGGAQKQVCVCPQC
jgi:hypothetical protein